MKKTVLFAVNTGTPEEKNYELGFNILDLRNMEKEFGQSIISVFSEGPKGLVKQVDTNFTVAALRNGLPERLPDDQVYDLIQQYCDAGHELDEINSLLIRAIMETGLFTPDKKKKETKNAADAKKQGK